MMNNIIQEYLHKAITNGDTITIKYIKLLLGKSVRFAILMNLVVITNILKLFAILETKEEHLR